MREVPGKVGLVDTTIKFANESGIMEWDTIIKFANESGIMEPLHRENESTIHVNP